MAVELKYTSGGAFRRALEQRLNSRALTTGVPLLRLRKLVAFDRFLARLVQGSPDTWILKGGLALQLRLGIRARTTNDLDVLATIQRDLITDTIREAASIDLQDWFTYEVASPARSIQTGWGGLRHPVQALLDGRLFEKFHVDVGAGDVLIGSVDTLNTTDLLAFAGIPPARVACYPLTQQIAEKLHAYTRPHPYGESSRVKDFVDLLLMAELEPISGSRLREAINATFTTEKTHDLPSAVPAPPRQWSSQFRQMAKTTGAIYQNLDDAYQIIQLFLDPVLSGENVLVWEPSGQHWRK